MRNFSFLVFIYILVGQQTVFGGEPIDPGAPTWMCLEELFDHAIFLSLNRLETDLTATSSSFKWQIAIDPQEEIKGCPSIFNNDFSEMLSKNFRSFIFKTDHGQITINQHFNFLQVPSLDDPIGNSIRDIVQEIKKSSLTLLWNSGFGWVPSTGNSLSSTPSKQKTRQTNSSSKGIFDDPKTILNRNFMNFSFDSSSGVIAFQFDDSKKKLVPVPYQKFLEQYKTPEKEIAKNFSGTQVGSSGNISQQSLTEQPKNPDFWFFMFFLFVILFLTIFLIIMYWGRISALINSSVHSSVNPTKIQELSDTSQLSVNFGQKILGSITSLETKIDNLSKLIEGMEDRLPSIASNTPILLAEVSSVPKRKIPSSEEEKKELINQYQKIFSSDPLQFFQEFNGTYFISGCKKLLRQNTNSKSMQLLEFLENSQEADFLAIKIRNTEYLIFPGVHRIEHIGILIADDMRQARVLFHNIFSISNSTSQSCEPAVGKMIGGGRMIKIEKIGNISLQVNQSNVGLVSPPLHY